MQYLILFLMLFSFSFASDCNDEYNYKNFPTASEELKDVLGDSLNSYLDRDIKIFKNFQAYDIQGSIYYLKRDSFVKLKDYYYPKKNGVWKLHVNENNKIDEIDFAVIKLYQDPVEDLANELNEDLGNLWLKWDGDAYGYKMVPEYTQLHLDNFYIALDAFIYGSENDATGLKNSVVNLHIINYTHEVNEFIKCLHPEK